MEAPPTLLYAPRSVGGGSTPATLGPASAEHNPNGIAAEPPDWSARLIGSRVWFHADCHHRIMML